MLKRILNSVNLLCGEMLKISNSLQRITRDMEILLEKLDMVRDTTEEERNAADRQEKLFNEGLANILNFGGDSK